MSKSRLSVVLLFSVFSFASEAACFSVGVRKEGDTCRAYVSNNCGQPLRCFVSVVGYTSQGQSYRETGTIHVGNGDEEWYGVRRVAACGDANARCERHR